MSQTLEGSQSWNLELGTEAEIMEELCFFGLLNVLSYITQDHLLRGGTAHRGLSPPTSFISQDNATQACLQASLTEVIC